MRNLVDLMMSHCTQVYVIAVAYDTTGFLIHNIR